MKFICVFIFLLIALTQAYKSYSGYQVFRTSVLDESSVKKLAPLLGRPEFDFWARPRVGQEADIMTSPQFTQQLWDTLVILGLQPSVLIPNVKKVVENERYKISNAKQKVNSSKGVSFDRFMDFDEIQTYLDEVVATYPEIASIETIGESYEGRTLRVLKLSNGPGKSGIWIESAIHAREWISVPVNLYAINELTENLATNQAMLDANDFYFQPVVNPDGYVYTWTGDRYWRKSRSPNPGSDCIGTDLNRNFDLHWGEGNVDECSNNWHGSAPFSEPEVKALSDYLIKTSSITFYAALHSQGQLFLSPWSWTSDLPENYDEMFRVGTEAATALEAVRGTVYDVGTSANTLYFSYGNSKDWAHGSLNIPLAYTIELPKGGEEGHDPPPEDIIPVVTETWEAIKVLAANIPPSRG